MGILREVDGTGLALVEQARSPGRGQCLDFKSYRRLWEALMSYIREKLFPLFFNDLFGAFLNMELSFLY
jgi:hypothetical protein